MDWDEIADCLQWCRGQTLRSFQGFIHSLGEQCAVPYKESLNPPLWEFGHVAWFQTYWITRNKHRHQGLKYPTHIHAPPHPDQPDAIFNSSLLAHSPRWELESVTAEKVLAMLERGLNEVLECLAKDAASDGTSPYFYQLAVAHECMHLEAFLMQANQLGIAAESVSAPGVLPDTRHSGDQQTTRIHVPAQTVMSHAAGPDIATQHHFFFDNECPPRQWLVEAFEIDSRPVSYGQYAPILERRPHSALRTGPKGLEKRSFGEWTPVDESAPVSNIRLDDAQAWCEMHGRRLPTEAEWLAASTLDDFAVGEVWEWTADPFVPFEGFSPHPYADYSKPWFGDHQLLKGWSWATPTPIRDRQFRNFYKPHRADVFNGFRSVSK
ncbi:MAG: hypothetical protein RLY67_172 [Pseudomonadota bacterium]